MAGHTQLGCGCGGLAGVVRLRGALCHDRVGALLDRIGHKVFQLSCFVAAGGQPRAIVAFDPKARATQRFA